MLSQHFKAHLRPAGSGNQLPPPKLQVPSQPVLIQQAADTSAAAKAADQSNVDDQDSATNEFVPPRKFACVCQPVLVRVP
jgi:hypothetical protein